MSEKKEIEMSNHTNVKVRRAGETAAIEIKPKRKRRTRPQIEAENLIAFEKAAKEAVAEFMRNKRNVR